MTTQLSAHAAHPLSTEDRTHYASVRGVVFNIQRYSLHDGPGVRTNVFLKGCPLRCQWCANPESQQFQPELALSEHNCIACGLFETACTTCWSERCLTHERAPSNQAPPGSAASKQDPAQGSAASDQNLAQASLASDQDQAQGSATSEPDLAQRVAICPTGALHWIGEWRSAEEILREVRRDRPFYGDGGGMTLTGGEPTLQPALCEALLQLARAEGIDAAMETCGHTQWAVLARLAPLLDTVLFDLKHVDPGLHHQFTGMDNALILDNLRRLVELGARVRVRVPLIPGFNAAPEQIAAIAAYVQQLPGPVAGLDLLPYHTLGRAKYAALGRPYPWAGHPRLTSNEVETYAATVRAHGLPVTIGG